MNAGSGTRSEREGNETGRLEDSDQADPQLRPLSDRQNQILRFIRTELKTRGYAPSVQEMADASVPSWKRWLGLG